MVCIYWQCLIHDWALNINYPEKSQDSSLTAQEFHCSKYILTFLWLLMSVVAIVCIGCDGHQTASFICVIGLIFSRVNGTLKLQWQTNHCHTFVHQSVQSVMVCKWISGSISEKHIANVIFSHIPSLSLSSVTFSGKCSLSQMLWQKQCGQSPKSNTICCKPKMLSFICTFA